MKLDRYDIALSRIATQEDFHPLQRCVHYTDGRLETSDGFVLVRRPAELTEGETLPPFMIPSEMLRGVKSDKKRVANLTTDGKLVAVTYSDEKGQPLPHNPSLRFEAVGGKYPDTDRLLPKAPHRGRIAINASLLRKALSCVPDQAHLQIGFGPTETSAIEIVVSNMDRPIHIVLMPMYVDWQGFEWPRPTPPQPVEQQP